MKYLFRFLGWVFSWTFLGGIVGLALIAMVIGYYNRDLPNVRQLADHKPATISRVYAADGSVMDEFISEKRLYTPSEEIPDLVKQAFISAEDKNFFTHNGYDIRGIGSALYDAVSGGRMRGASTITQQVAKIFYLSGEQTADRKLREVRIAQELERRLTKDQILGLYLNEIFLGENSYGVTAAARTYFNKRLEDLTPGEAAYLAALPKAPSTYHPVREVERATARRDFVLKEMMENGFIESTAYDEAIATPLQSVQNGDFKGFEATSTPRDYFTEEIRQQLIREFGEEAIMKGGISARATIDFHLQEIAADALRRSLENYDRSQGVYHKPLATIDPNELENWEEVLAGTSIPRDIPGWYPAVVLTSEGKAAQIGIDGFGLGELKIGDISWARPRLDDGNLGPAPNTVDDIYNVGDVVLVKRKDNGWTLRQVPKVQGAFTAMDPKTGRVLAMQGGFSYQYSNFNRATQAQRQPGSSIKPFVYAAALDNNYSPVSIVVDAPMKINTPQGLWTPKNASNRFYGPAPLQVGLEQSRNLMTVRLAADVGMDIVTDYGEKFGIYDEMLPVLSNALGSQETTLYRMVSAYGTFANGGREVRPTLVDRVQDRDGNTIYRHDQRVCEHCVGDEATIDTDPVIYSMATQVMDPITAYQMTLMMQGVVSNGTAKSTVGKLGYKIAGKTGTTNDAKDAWFIGYTPRIVAGCYIGYDDPRPLGRGQGGGTTCGPVFARFIAEAVKQYRGFEFDVPSGGYLATFDRATGKRVDAGENTFVQFIREGQDVGEGIIIDGGFDVDEDVEFVKAQKKETESRKTETKAKVGGEVKRLPAKPTANTLSSGGLY